MKDRIISNVSKTSVPRKHPNNTIYNHYTDTVIFICMWHAWYVTVTKVDYFQVDTLRYSLYHTRVKKVNFAVSSFQLELECFKILNAWLINYDSSGIQSGMNIKNVSFGIVTDVKVISISFLSNQSSINLLVNSFIFTNKNFILSFGVPGMKTWKISSWEGWISKGMISSSLSR